MDPNHGLSRPILDGGRTACVPAVQRYQEERVMRHG